MDNFEKPQKSFENQYSRAFYTLSEQIDNAKKKIEDPNTPEEEKQNILEAIKSAEGELDKLDTMDKEYRGEHNTQDIGRDAIRSVKSSEMLDDSEKAGADNDQMFIAPDGTVHKDAESARLGSVEQNNWHSYTDK